jgi:hypothetical protein
VFTLYNIYITYGYAESFMNTATKTATIVIIATIVGYVASFLVPVPAGWSSESLNFHWSLANSVLYTLLHAGAAVLFISGISAYKAALRSAYIKIAIGIVLVGGGLAQVVLLNIFGLIQTPWVQYGGVMLPFIVAGLAIYFGTRSMAILVGVKSLLVKLWFVLPLLILSVGIFSLLPHSTSNLPELFFDIANAISVGDLVLYAASLGLVLQIRSRSGEHYKNALTWLTVGLIGSVIITSYVLIGTFLTGEEPEGRLLDAIVITGGLLYLKAGYSFAKTKEL